jgi:hypothetical protein
MPDEWAKAAVCSIHKKNTRMVSDKVDPSWTTYSLSGKCWKRHTNIT